MKRSTTAFGVVSVFDPLAAQRGAQGQLPVFLERVLVFLAPVVVYKDVIAQCMPEVDRDDHLLAID
jgi:hypothetical protein